MTQRGAIIRHLENASALAEEIEDSGSPEPSTANLFCTTRCRMRRKLGEVFSAIDSPHYFLKYKPLSHECSAACAANLDASSVVVKSWQSAVQNKGLSYVGRVARADFDAAAFGCEPFATAVTRLAA